MHRETKRIAAVVVSHVTLRPLNTWIRKNPTMSHLFPEAKLSCHSGSAKQQLWGWVQIDRTCPLSLPLATENSLRSHCRVSTTLVLNTEVKVCLVMALLFPAGSTDPYNATSHHLQRWLSSEPWAGQCKHTAKSSAESSFQVLSVLFCFHIPSVITFSRSRQRQNHQIMLCG